MVIHSKFDIGDRLLVDGDRSICGVVTLIEWRAHGHVRYEISYFATGDAKFVVFYEYRLEKA